MNVHENDLSNFGSYLKLVLLILNALRWSPTLLGR